MTLPNIAPDVWAHRPILKDIRDAAHRRTAGADAVLWSFLASVAAHMPAHVEIDTGVATPVRPTLFVALAGASGTGKSVAWGTARALLPGQPEPFPLSTGEGLIESFYGFVWEHPEPAALPEPVVASGAALPTAPDGGPKPAKAPKPIRVRRRVRNNALFWLDEGEQLFRQAERVGSVVHPTLRSFWSGGTVGQANATDELRRSLDAGSYTGGLVIGLQPDVSGKLLSDTATGTAQRFVWTATTDRYQPDDEPGAGYDLRPITWAPPVLPNAPSRIEQAMSQPVPGQPFALPEPPPPVAMQLDGEIAAGLRTRAIRLRRGDEQPDVHDTQRPAMHVKVAGVLAWLDGRLWITADDWHLAAALLATSDQVRDALLDHAEMVAAAERAERGVERAQVSRAEALAERTREHCQRRVVETVSRQGAATGGELKRALTKGQRAFLAETLTDLIAAGALVVEVAANGGQRYRPAGDAQ